MPPRLHPPPRKESTEPTHPETPGGATSWLQLQLESRWAPGQQHYWIWTSLSGRERREKRADRVAAGVPHRVTHPQKSPLSVAELRCGGCHFLGNFPPKLGWSSRSFEEQSTKGKVYNTPRNLGDFHQVCHVGLCFGLLRPG